MKNYKTKQLTENELMIVNGGQSEATIAIVEWAGYMYEGVKSNLSKFWDGLTSVGSWYNN